MRVALDYEHVCLPGLPPTGNSKRNVSLTGDAAARLASLTSCMPFAGPHAPMLRGFVESHWSDPLLHDKYYSRPQPSVDFLIASPYVDNGKGHPQDSLEEKWAAEHMIAFGPGGRRMKDIKPVHNAAPTEAPADGTTTSTRPTSIFFGGRTSTRIGPG